MKIDTPIPLPNGSHQRTAAHIGARLGLTIRSTRTLPLRGIVLDQRSDFPSLANRAASAAPVSFAR